MKAVHVDVRVNPIQYEVYMGTDLLDRMAQDLQEKPLAKRYAVLSDDRVSGLYGKKMMESLESSSHFHRERPVKTGKRKNT